MCVKHVVLLLMCLVILPVLGQNNVIDEVVWVVGDEAILKSEVESERLNAQYEGRKFDGDPYCIIPEELAVQKLFLHQAEIDSIEVSEQEVIREVERRHNWLIDQIGSKEKLEEYYNKTSTQIREMLRENIRSGLIVQRMQQKIVGDIKIVPADVPSKILGIVIAFWPVLFYHIGCTMDERRPHCVCSQTDQPLAGRLCDG